MALDRKQHMMKSIDKMQAEHLQRIIIGCFGVLALAIGVWFGSASILRLRFSVTSLKWESTQGYILQSWMEPCGEPQRRAHFNCWPIIKYEYEVNGQRYIGDR